MSEWRFQRRQSGCRACAKAFEEGERHASVLRVAGETVEREDVCSTCHAERDGAGLVFYWFTRHRTDRRKLQLDLATLEQLFVQLEGRAERGIREMRYVLCLLLMRKRRLKLERVQRGADGESMLVRRPRRKEGFEVFVFDFSPDRMGELRRDLLAVFEGAEPWSSEPVGGTSAPGDPLRDEPSSQSASIVAE
jgi:hypothetical protein